MHQILILTDYFLFFSIIFRCPKNEEIYVKRFLNRTFCTKIAFTGCPKSPVPISFSIFSTIIFDRINFFFLKDRPIHKVFFHKNMVYKYSFELSVFTKIQNFDLYRNGVNSFQKRFLIRFCLLI